MPINPGLTYYVTRYEGTRRLYLTPAGNFSPDVAKGRVFASREEADRVCMIIPGSWVDGFIEAENR